MRFLFSRVAGRYRREGFGGLARGIVDRINKSNIPHPIENALRQLATRPVVSIVQIGAFIGPTPNDPIHHFIRDRAGPGLQAVLVEPVRKFYDRLRENYSGLQGVHCENLAIAETPSERDFYRLGVDPREYGFPDWLEQLGSLRGERMTELWDRCEANESFKEFYLKHRVIDRVRCVTLMGLLEQYGIDRLDLLQIDAEGYDYEILKTLDFARVRPQFINYERVLLDKDTDDACRTMLRSRGYRLHDYSEDTFCTRRS